MIEPTYDKDGCPTDETLKSITEWPFDDPAGWLTFCRDSWDEFYGKVRWDLLPGCLIHAEFITGGWSNNEVVVSAMRKNFMLWSRCWVSSHRGGLDIFEEPGR